MKNFKVISILIIIIFIINMLMPIIAYGVENVPEEDIIIKEDNSKIDEEENKQDGNIEEKDDEILDNEIDTEGNDNLKDEEDKTQDDMYKEDESQIENAITDDEITDETKAKEDNQEEIQPISNIDFSANILVNEYKINTYLQNGIYYFFVPRNIDISNLVIQYNYGVDISDTTSGVIDTTNKTITNDFSTKDEITLTAQDKKQYKIKVMQSDIASICINLDTATLQQVNSGSKDTKYAGKLQVVGASDSKYDITDKTIELKGRGNTTWNFKKKPYQIKFDKKENLLGLNGKAKKWILLANYVDRTLLRNQLMFDLQKEMGLSNAINGEFVDLYVNGEYIGNYLVCDKVDVAESRINLQDPKGLVCEMDAAYGKFEQYNFTTKISQMTFVVKESVSDEGTPEYMQAKKDFENYINKLESLMYAKNPNWNEISKLIDVDSFVRYYFLIELAEDADRFISSTYFYKDGENDVLHIGPIWDSDTALGYHNSIDAGSNTNVDYTLNMEKYRGSKQNWYNQLYRNKDFVALLNKTYNNEIKPVFATAVNKIDNYVDKMKKSIQMNYIRWNNVIGAPPELGTSHKPSSTYNGEVQYLRNWVSNRVSYLNQRYSKNDVVQYTTYIEAEKWEDQWKNDGQLSGTTGQCKKLEDIKISLANPEQGQSIKYNVHVQDIGWTGWISDGNPLGTQNRGLKIEAIQIKLEGMSEYSVQYRVHVEDIGWQEWRANGQEAGTTGQNKRIEAIEIKVEKRRYLGNETKPTNANINYTANLQDIGWTGYAKDGETMGTMWEGRRIEAIKIDVGSSVSNAKLSYRTHIQDIGWQGWKTNGQESGTVGRNLKIEAIQINVSPSSEYYVEYRTYVENIGWQDWVKNGDVAGTTGRNLRVEAIEIKLQKKKFLGNETPDSNAKVQYKGHMENIGWSGYGIDGETIGTMWLEKRMEAIEIKLGSISNSDIQYRVHVEDIGWQDWKKNGEVAGTTGRCLRIEAIEIKMTNSSLYDVQYRTYVQNIGWQDWKKNGETSGTTGKCLRVEAIQIRVIEK